MTTQTIHNSTQLKSELPKLGRVVIIDDNESDLELLRATLQQNFILDAATDGASGFELALEVKPDCIVSDVRMPEMSGFTLLKKIRTHQDLSDIPVILLTALDEPSDKVQGYDLMADLYLTKPIDINELLAAVRSLTRLHRKRKPEDGEIAEPNQGISGDDQSFLNRLITVIHSNISNPDFKVEDLAKAVFSSRRQLERRLKELEHITPAQYIRQIRLEEAKKLIAIGAYKNIQELSQRVGLRDAKHFSKIFKSQYGYAPIPKP